MFDENGSFSSVVFLKFKSYTTILCEYYFRTYNPLEIWFKFFIVTLTLFEKSRKTIKIYVFTKILYVERSFFF